jgi:serine protease AprX
VNTSRWYSDQPDWCIGIDGRLGRTNPDVSGFVSQAEYIGIAPNANLINLRVLNKNGIGSASGLLNALNWVMANRATYNIRIVNMSLGMTAVDSYKNDPVCLAVRQLTNAGVVIVVAAGNNGKDSSGDEDLRPDTFARYRTFGYYCGR